MTLPRAHFSLITMQDLQEALDSCTWLPVAPGWTEHFAPGIQQPFYFHQATGRKQWQRPAAVETEPTTPLRGQSQSTFSVSSQQLSRPSSYTSEAPDSSLKSAAIRMKQKRSRSQARSAVSCPCDASDACAAVFDMRNKEDQRASKRIRDEEVTSRLADLQVQDSATQLIDSASELAAARAGASKFEHSKLSSSLQPEQNKQQVKESLRRSSSCPWTPKQFEYVRNLSALQC